MTDLFIYFFFILRIASPVNLPGSLSDSTHLLHTAFQSGEKLRYRVNYGVIKGGEAALSIETVPVGYGFLLHIKAVAQTTGLVGDLVTIHDVYESYVHILSGSPVKAIRNIREHKYEKYNELLFFRSRHFVRSLQSGDHPVPDNMMDILSAFYFARRYLFTHDMKKNQMISLPVFFDDEIFLLRLKFKKKEEIRTRYGKVRCLKFVPDISNLDIFTKEKQLQIWITDDSNFVPVRIKAKLPVGNVKMNIIDFDGLKDPKGELVRNKL